jgi:hypothetical protein
MTSLPLLNQNFTPQQQLKFLSNEQQLWLREARKQGRIAKRARQAGINADAADALASARKALKEARQINALLTKLRRELREQQKQSRNGSVASHSFPIHAASEPRIATPQ